MIRVYVAGLYSRNPDGSTADVIGVLANMREGLRASAEVLNQGYAVFSPWLDFQYGLLENNPTSKRAYQNNSMAWLEVSDAVLVISGEGIGSGVDAEIHRAHELNIPIYRSIHELIANMPPNFHRDVKLPCPNCGAWRNSKGSILQKCENCGDDEYDFSHLTVIP